MAGGYGIVMRIDTKTDQPVSVTRMGDWIEDMQMNLEGRIAPCGSFRLAVLDQNGANMLWRDGSFVRGTRAAKSRNRPTASAQLPWYVTQGVVI